VKPEYFRLVIKKLKESKICDVFFSDENKGKIVVTLEGESTEEEMNKLKMIQNFEYVISAKLGFSYNEGELEESPVKKEEITAENSATELRIENED